MVLEPGKSATEEELVEYAKNCGKLATYEVPRRIDLVDSLPKTTVGKVLRRELARMEREKA